MSSADKEKANFKDGLLRQGVPAEEIEKVYRSLREKGYGEEEARRRSRATAERLRILREMERRRNAQNAREGRAASVAAPAVSAAASRGELGRRAVDWVPAVPQWLRRRINRYAYRNGYLITRLPQRLEDFMSHFDASRPDLVSRALLALLADEKGFQKRNPYNLSFVDTLDALRESAGRLMGRRHAGPSSHKAEETLAKLRAREPFAVEFFSVFTQPYDMLRKSLEYLGNALRARTPVRVSDLARVVKDGCRLIAITDTLEREKLVPLFDAAREVNMETAPSARAAGELLEAESLFRACFQNLGRFAHEM